MECGEGKRRPGSRRGFVLAEALVVAVIVASLAAVAIPVYTGYVRNQRHEAAKSIAQTAAVSANVYFRRNGVDPADSAALNLFLPDPARYTVRISGRFIIVTDNSNPDNPIVDSAFFR